MLPGYDVYIRRVIESGVPIFPEAIVLTEAEREAAVAQGRKVESIERLKSSNKGKFYGQYLNDPMDDSLLEFKREWFQTFTLTPGSIQANEMPVAPVLISLDPAFTLGRSNDDSGIVVTKTLSDNNVYVLEAKGIKANPQMLVDEIFHLVEKYVIVDRILIETVTSQIMLMDLLNSEMRKRGKFFSIQEVKPDNNEKKAVRIRSLIPHYSNRRIYHAPGACWKLEEQLIEFGSAQQHDDVIDALAYQVKFWRPFNMAEARPGEFKENTMGWWKQQGKTKPTVIGKLFRDIR